MRRPDVSFKTNRRSFLATGGVSLAAAALATPALAQGNPRLRWRMPSSFGRNLDALYGSAQVFIDTVKDMTEGQFEISWFAPGEVVPPLAVAPAVAQGTIELGQTASFYHTNLDPTYQLGSGLPFGMNVRGHAAWLVNGGGNELMNTFWRSQGLVGLFAGNTGAQMAGWFRREIRNIEDVRGLKMRIAGIAGTIFARAGGVPQQIPPGDIYAALERGTIDGTKFTSPLDDEKLGFVRVAPYYYYPGWNDAGVAVHVFVNAARFDALPKHYQAVLRAAAAQAGEWMQTKYDAENPKAVRRIVAAGAQLRVLPNDVIDALHQSAQTVYGELSAQNAGFKRVLDHYQAFVQDHYLWWQVAEFSYDAMMLRLRRR